MHRTTAGHGRSDHSPDPGGAATRHRRRTALVAGLAVVALGTGAIISASLAAAGTGNLPSGASPLPASTQFDVTGFLQSATLDGALTAKDPGAGLHGGHLTVNGQDIVVPNNTIVILPANALTWEELFTQAPPPYGPNATGLAMQDSPTPISTYEVHVVGNRVGDRYIAGMVNISQNDLNAGAGYINFIDYNVGTAGQPELRIGGMIDDPNCVGGTTASPNAVAGGALCTGTRVKINDPNGRFTRGGADSSADPRFTVDPDNPTIAAGTGFPMCIPRTDSDPVKAYLANGNVINPAVDDPLCPLANRVFRWDANNVVQSGLENGTPGGFSNSTNLSPTAPGYAYQPDQQIPMEVGDYVSFAGDVNNDSVTPISAVPGASTYISAHTIISNFAGYTKPGDPIAYVSIEVSLIGTGGLTVIGAGEAAVRTRFEGMSTDPTRKIHMYAIDINPITHVTTDRDLGAVMPDPGPPNGAVTGRWRLRPPCTAAAGAETDKLCSKPPLGVYTPPTAEVRAVIDGVYTPDSLNPPTAANGIIYGQYHAPVDEYIFPENVPGTPIVPNNFEAISFLAYGGYSSSQGTFAGQLDPWPGAGAPAMPVCPAPSAGGPYIVPTGGSIQLSGSAGPNATLPATYQWAASNASNVDITAQVLTNATTLNPTLSIPVGFTGGPISITLTVTNLCGPFTSAATTATIQDTAPTVAVSNPSQTVTGGASVTITATSPTAGVTSFTFSQTGGTAIAGLPKTVAATLVGGVITGKLTFTAPVTPGTLTFNVVSTKLGVSSSPAAATVTVSPPTNITLTGAEYRTGKNRLSLTATYTGPVTDTLVLQPYKTEAGAIFDPATLGNTFTLSGGVYTLTLVTAPPPACNPGGVYATPCAQRPLVVVAVPSLGATPNGTSGPQALQRIRQ